MLPCVWFNNRSQKTSNCGKDISDTVRYASCATFLFLPHFDVICDLLLNRRKATWNLFVLYNNEKPFLFQNFNITRKPAFCSVFASPLHEKKPFDVIYDPYKIKQFHWLLCVAKNCDWSRKIAPLSNLTRASLLVKWKLTAKAELTELRNLQILKEIREKSSHFLSLEQPCEPKSLDVALKITGVEKIPSENLWLRST